MWTICLLAFAVAIAATAVLGRFGTPERWEDSEVAENILRGAGACRPYLQGTIYCFYGSAIYPWILAGALKLSRHGEAIVLVLNAILFAATCAIVYLTALPLGERVAGLAALLSAVHPGAVIYATKLHPQTLDVFLVLLTLFLIGRTTSATNLRSAFCRGLVAGLAALSRGTVTLFLPFWAFWFAWKNREHSARAVWIVLAVAFGSVLAVAPVLLRGYAIYGTLIPLRTDSGLNLWLGNHAGATGTPHASAFPVVMATSRLPQELLDRIEGRDEVEQNRILTSAVLDFVRTHPREVGVLFVKKLFYFWWFSPHAGLFYPRAWLSFYVAYYGVVVFLALIGLLVSLRSQAPAARNLAEVFLLLAIPYSVTQAMFYVEGRQRWQIELPLLMFAAKGMFSVLPPFATVREPSVQTAR
jgi:4-amino-4-deoxy-L-arabinose transferase-like glycosyltransferase